MKNIFLIISTIILFAIPIFGQATFGLKGGPNYSNILFNSEDADLDKFAKESTNGKFGFHAGIFLHLPLSEKLAFKPELLFSTQGEKIMVTEPYELHLNYLSLPLLMEVNISKKIGLIAGPHINYQLTATSNALGESQDVQFVFDNDWEVGVTGGLFFQLANNLRINARYQQSISTISESQTFFLSPLDDPLPTSGEVKNRNQVVQVGVEYFFGGTN